MVREYKRADSWEGLDSAEVVSNFCNACFRKAPDEECEKTETRQHGGSEREGYLKPPKFQAIRIAHAVTQALINKSGGCCTIIRTQSP